MPGFILVIEDHERLTPVVESAVEDANVRVVTADSFAVAKRKLIQAAPNLIISAASIATDISSDGYKFCRDLKQHSELSRIPVILVAESLSGDSIRSATEAGASGLMPWPITPAVLRGRIAPLVPELIDAVEQEVLPPPAQSGKPPAAAAPAKESGEAGEKIQLAQRLLAQVLHNLKTSDLLQIVDLEDVPRVVSEITRKVCGMSKEEPSSAPAAASNPETVLDLDSAFRLKD